jgi:protein-disulfide isomerase
MRPRPVPARASLFLLLVPPALALIGGCPTVQAPSPLLDVQSDDHILAVGSPRLTIIEYGDFECPYCGEFARDTFPTFKAQYIDTGKVRWVYRHFPLNGHPRAKPAAEASESAAAQGRFWEYLELLYQNQTAFADTDLQDYAAQLGLDPAAFSVCQSSGVQAARVDRDAQSATALGAFATPTFFIGTVRVDGAPTLSEFTSLVDQALAQTQ